MLESIRLPLDYNKNDVLIGNSRMLGNRLEVVEYTLPADEESNTAPSNTSRPSSCCWPDETTSVAMIRSQTHKWKKKEYNWLKRLAI